MSIKAYKFRIQANKATSDQLQWVLDRARELYNAGLQERRDACEMHVKRHPGYYDEETRKRLSQELCVDYYEQKRELVDIKELRSEYADIASHVLQDVIMRVKRTYDRFFKATHRRTASGFTQEARQSSQAQGGQALSEAAPQDQEPEERFSSSSLAQAGGSLSSHRL